MARTPSSLTAALAFLLLGPTARAGDIDPQVRQEVLSGWAELERIDDARPAVDTTWTTRESGGPSAGTRSGTGRYRRKGELVRVFGEREDGRAEEAGLNSKYLFSVARESSSHPWTMRFVELDLAGPKAKQLQDSLLSAKVVAPASTVLIGSALRQQRKPGAVLGDPDFKLTGIDRLPDGQVRVHYQHRLVVGEFDCDPTTSYVIKRGRSVEKGKRLECRMTFERHFGPPGPDGRPAVERLTSEVVDTPGSTRTSETTYSYPDVSRTGDLDDEKFRLTAYGLPEPEGVVWEKPRRWLPYGLAAAGLVLVAVTTWLLRRTRPARPAEVRT